MPVFIILKAHLPCFLLFCIPLIFFHIVIKHLEPFDNLRERLNDCTFAVEALVDTLLNLITLGSGLKI
jgi:hypothetical protein